VCIYTIAAKPYFKKSIICYQPVTHIRIRMLNNLIALYVMSRLI